MGSTARVLVVGTDGKLYRLLEPVALTTPVLSDNGTKPGWIEGSTLGSGAVTAHEADTTDAHDASAISIVDAGTYFTGTDVEAALQELGAAAGGGATERPDIGRNYSVVKSECFFQATGNVHEGGIAQSASGTAAATSAGTPVALHPGIIQLSTGSTSGGTCRLTGGATVALASGQTVTFGVVFKIPTLSDGTNTFAVELGLYDSGVNWVMFDYDPAARGNANWWISCKDQVAGTSSTDTGTAADTNWHYFQIVVTGSTAAVFSMDGASAGTISTNVPTHNVAFTPIQILKSVGTTARTALIDAYWYIFELSSNR